MRGEEADRALCAMETDRPVHARRHGRLVCQELAELLSHLLVELLLPSPEAFFSWGKVEYDSSFVTVPVWLALWIPHDSGSLPHFIRFL